MTSLKGTNYFILSVLSEHPGADFAFVAKEMADRWKALDREKKEYYSDRSKAEAEKYHREVRQVVM